MANPDEVMVQSDPSWDVLADVARALRATGPRLADTLEAIVTQATRTIAGADWAGLIELKGGRLEPRATIGEAPRILDGLQQQTGRGPCIDAARRQSLLTLDDMTEDSRWPGFAARAERAGVGSMLCAPLWVDRQRLGTLSIYSARTRAFDVSAQRLTELYATLAALALADGQRVANLTLALDSRDMIGQAKGILIERLKIAPDKAFLLLSETSQNLNLKVSEVAERLVRTGDLPT